MSKNTAEQDARLKALADHGWQLVLSKPVRVENLGDGLTRQIDGEYRLERLRPAGETGVINAFGHDMDQALDAAEYEQACLEEIAEWKASQTPHRLGDDLVRSVSEEVS